MAEKGWNETSIDEITREAGVSRGLVSYHFRDKAALLSGVLTRCQESFAELIRSSQMPDAPRDLRMRGAIRTALQFVRDDPTIYEVFLHFVANARSNPELGDQVRALYEDFRRVTANSIQKGQEEGAFRTDIDPAVAATRQNAAITGFALQWLLDPNCFDFEETARQTEDMLMLYLTSGPLNGGTASTRSGQSLVGT